MVLRNRKIIFCIPLFCISLLTLTGCPGSGDKFIPEEEAKISLSGRSICFWVSNTEGYRLSDITIYPRNMPGDQRKYMFGSDIEMINGKICVPPLRWPLPDNGQFIARYFLTPVSPGKPFRKVTTGFEISKGEVKTIPLTTREAVR